MEQWSFILSFVSTTCFSFHQVAIGKNVLFFIHTSSYAKLLEDKGFLHWLVWP